MTVAEILPIADISQYVASNAIDNAGLFGGGEDLLLPRKLYCVRKNVERLYDLDPSNDTLFQTSRYLYALCGKYKFKAASITGTGGSVVPIIPQDADCTGLVFITAADFEADGKTVFRPDWQGKALQIFFNNINRFIIPPEWQYESIGGFKILLPADFDSNGANSDCQFMVFVGCVSPGALFVPANFPINEYLIIPANSGSDYVLSWTLYYSTKYGVGAFDVFQDFGDSIWVPTGLQPSTDSDSTPTYYSFNVNDLRTKIIFN